MTTGENRRARGGLEEALRGSAPVIVLAALCVWAYVDLKTDIAEIAGRGTARETEAVEAPAVVDPRPVTGREGAEPSPAAPPDPSTDPAPLAAPAARVDWECAGAIEQAKVIEAIGKQGQSVFDCYSRSLVDVPDLKGTLLLELNVGGAGQVREARVKGPVKDPALLACVSEAVYGWTFPVPEHGDCAVVSVPFLLDPRDHAPAPGP